uniref:Membrane protein containing DUF540 n=1 Tax=Magnetospirillum gryphiswaldense TaxID=55518 RepID=A4U306_9PROT|nr:membrane protein containing DUF540 [Magnetospirillum gryphiswaldense MSR-1]
MRAFGTIKNGAFTATSPTIRGKKHDRCFVEGIGAIIRPASGAGAEIRGIGSIGRLCGPGGDHLDGSGQCQPVHQCLGRLEQRAGHRRPGPGAAHTVFPILFFPALATTIMGPMLDGVADAVDARHYPHLAAARPQPTTEVILGTLRFLALTVIINLAALPLYGILLFTGLTVLLVTAINGYLLGREYFEMAALRRLEPAMVRALFKARLGQVWLAGVVIAFLFSVPLLNLAAPVIAAAFMTHVAETLRMRANSV